MTAKVAVKVAVKVTAKSIKVGDQAPDFSIMTLENKIFKLKDHRGKRPVYLIFWNTWCPACIKKMPVYQNTHTFHGEEIAIVAINTARNDPFDNLAPFAERHQLDLPMAYDFGSKITDSFGVMGTPTTFIIDINGLVRLRNNIPDDIEALLVHWQK